MSRAGTPEYRRAVVAVLLCGLATFNALYSTQALLPEFTRVFGVSPTVAALSMSATTMTLAVCVVPASILSEHFGRGRVLVIATLLATGVGLVVPFADAIGQLIVLRGVQGIALAGVPAVAMAWLGEEIHPKDLPGAMGLYIAGNSLGGIIGRLAPTLALGAVGWRWAMVISAALTVAAALGLAALLPRQRRFVPKGIRLRGEVAAMVGHWRNRELALLFLTSFLVMGVFVSMFNYVGFRLTGHFGLSDVVIGLVFLMYLAATVTSARAARAHRRFGMRGTMVISAGLMAMALLFSLGSLPLLVLGLVIFSGAFFLLHTTASARVGLVATSHRAEASSMYLLMYYLGSSLVGAATGAVLANAGWGGLMGLLCVLCLVLMGIAALVKP